MMTFKEPGYLDLLNNGTLKNRVKSAHSHMRNCNLCPWQCGVDRIAGELGICKTGKLAMVSSFGPHHGEERPISSRYGSGTIFFTHCNLRCVYCQNADISQLGVGRPYHSNTLGEIMLDLQRKGCHNINFVSPSHVVPQILEAVYLAARKGLKLPLVYNSGGYDSLISLALLDGVVDIYMPDMKYGDKETAKKYSSIDDYPEHNQRAILEMQLQVGDLELDRDGTALRGLLVRHLVLPNDLANSEFIFKFLVDQVSKNVYLNIMAQYHPAYQAKDYPELNRRIQPKEFLQMIELAKSSGLQRLDV